MIGGMSTPPANWDARKGGIVRKRRQALGWDQRELAERVNVHVNSVQRWEAGKQYPGRRLGKLEAVLGITINDDEPGPEEPEMPTPEEAERLRAHMRELLGPNSPLEEALDRVLSGDPPTGGGRRGPAGGAAGGRSDSLGLRRARRTS